MKAFTLIIVVCLILALISFAFYDENLNFKEAYQNTIGNISNFASSVSAGFEGVVDFFKNIGDFINGLTN